MLVIFGALALTGWANNLNVKADTVDWMGNGSTGTTQGTDWLDSKETAAGNVTVPESQLNTQPLYPADYQVTPETIREVTGTTADQEAEKERQARIDQCIDVMGGNPDNLNASWYQIGAKMDVWTRITSGLCSLAVAVGDWFGGMLNWASEKIIGFIESVPKYFQEEMSVWTRDVWGTVRNLVDIIAIIALIIIHPKI